MRSHFADWAAHTAAELDYLTREQVQLLFEKMITRSSGSNGRKTEKLELIRWRERILRLALPGTGIFSGLVCGLHRCRHHQDVEIIMGTICKAIMSSLIMAMEVSIAKKESQIFIITNTNFGNGKRRSLFHWDFPLQIQIYRDKCM